MQSTRELSFELQNAIGQLRKANGSGYNSQSKLRGAEKHVLILICRLRSGQPVTISEIADKIGVTLAAVTHQINTLEKQGLIKRLSDGQDRRIVLIELTRKGKTQVINLKKEFAKKIRILTEFLGKKDTKDLIHLVKKMSGFRGFAKQ